MISLPIRIATAIIPICTSFFSFAQNEAEKIWVTFESTVDVPELIENELRSSNPSVQSLIDAFHITNVEQAVPSSSKEELLKVYEVSCQCDISELSAAIKTESRALSNPETAPNYQLLGTPDDYSLSYQSDYALDLIGAQVAWDYSIGDESTIIGISDANYFVAHEDLESQINYLDPLNISNNYYHGTAVAITAAGHTNNGLGKSSIGHNCKMDLMALGFNQVLEMSQRGVRVVNISWASGCSPNIYVQSIIDEIYENGTIIVAAAGNGSTCGGPTNPVFPAACDHVISVTSIGETDNHERIPGDPSSAHQHHSTVDICAPGYNVPISPMPGYYNTANGTSFAAPFVTGTIGLMLSLRPCLTYEEVLDILTRSSDDIYDTNPDYIGLLGSGRLNAGKALELAELNYCKGLNDPTGESPAVDTTGNGNITSSNNSDNSLNLVGTVGVDVNIDDTVIELIPDSQIGHVSDKVTMENRLSPNGSDFLLNEAKLFPNPTSGSATFQWNVNESMELTVFDIHGSIVIYRELLPGMTQAEINVEQSGVYFVRVTNRNRQAWLGKLVKL